MAGTRKVSNPLALAVLSYLTRGPMHPYELSRTLRENDDGRSFKFNHGSLYMVFGQLAKAGFVVPQETTREGQRPERTRYALTEAGRAEMRDWMRALVAEPEHEFPQFVAVLSLIAALPPDEVVELLGHRLNRLEEQRTEIVDLVEKMLATGEHPLFLIEEEYRLALLAAETAFVERFIGQITDPGSGWGPAWAQVLAGFPLPAADGEPGQDDMNQDAMNPDVTSYEAASFDPTDRGTASQNGSPGTP